MNAIEIAELRKTYPGGVEVVRGIDFAVPPGEVFGLLGPNGAVKSTTIGMLTTTIVPTAGRALRAREEMTILPTTHYLDEAPRLCDRVAIMHRGEIVGLDTPAALLADLGDEILELRVAGDAGAALLTLRERGVATDVAFAVGST